MAIKLPDPGNGIPEQKTGNDEWTNMKIVRENFADQSNAASRLVGTETGNVPEYKGQFGLSNTGVAGRVCFLDDTINVDTGEISDTRFENFYYLPNGFYYTNGPSHGSSKLGRMFFIQVSYGKTQGFRLASDTNGTTLYFQGGGGAAVGWREKREVYHTGNTTKDTATGFLKASSPVLHVYNDSFTKIHEAEQLDITVDKKGVGHYEIHGTTGLRKNDGWFMSPPRDVHGNVLCMVDLEEKDGVVVLRTYKKKFDFESVAIVHDFDNPMDIPEGVCVEFRFNDLPQEQLDEPIE